MIRSAFFCLAPVLLAASLAAKDAGVYYSTLYAYDPAYRMTRITDFGVAAQQRLFGDVNGDGRDDAVAVFFSADTGLQVQVAVSDGSDFVNPGIWLSWAAAQADDQPPFPRPPVRPPALSTAFTQKANS